MIKSIRLLVEEFFDDDIFDIGNDIKTDIEDLGRYYDFYVGDIFYQNKKPYAICCGEPKYFKNNKPRFCLYEETNTFDWKILYKLVKELGCFKINYFYLNTFNDFKHIDEDGYGNTLIIKNKYDISEFPSFKYCIELDDNVYLPAIDELLIMSLNTDNLSKYSFSSYNYYWSSSLYSANNAYSIYTYNNYICCYPKHINCCVRPFFCLD